MKYLCIHGHFYQPPRENPWLDVVEIQDSASPYHDWNARIVAECYWPNAAARVLGAGERITDIVNNYAKLSFNFGPTLTVWLARYEPDLLAALVTADRQSRERLRGHGNAIAQAYGHAILPLATLRDKQTQVRWGIHDFMYRFGRAPEGMWLPETAVDTATLEVLAAQGIGFTILAPHQARRVRPHGRSEWENVTEDTLDTHRPYLCRLPSGKQIVLFFYNSRLARGVAFERLLDSGDRLAERLVQSFRNDSDEPQLVHLATDGETYGHHHRFGEMALAYALGDIERRGLAKITNYGEFLAVASPQWEVEIVEGTSWSCAHGVERWRADCGCRTGGLPGWNQQWRAPLRAALDWLRAEIDVVFERQAGVFLRDPWAARDAYIELLLERSPDREQAFCFDHAGRPLSAVEQQSVFTLLELQRHRFLMFTSCGWFFDELSGLEGTQVLRYAARAIELAKIYGLSLEAEFVERLRRAPSNLPEIGDGGHLYVQKVRPTRVEHVHVVANTAMCQVLEPNYPHPVPPGFTVQLTDYEGDSYGHTALAVGRMVIRSPLTHETQNCAYAVLKLSRHDVHCVVRGGMSPSEYSQVRTALLETFARQSLSEVVRSLDRTFGEDYFTAKDLFLDDRRRVLIRVSEIVLDRVEESYRQLYRENRRLMEYLRELDVPLPQGFALAAEFLVNRTLTRVLSALVDESQNGDALDDVLADARKWQVPLATKEAEHLLCRAIEEHLTTVRETPLSDSAAQASRLLQVSEHLGLRPNLWRAQTLFAQTCQRHLRTLLAQRNADATVARQLATLQELGTQLQFAVVIGIPLDAWAAA
ncbi:MAG: DUF3536 domain-containing protein [Candidatus Binatia bacterium]